MLQKLCGTKRMTICNIFSGLKAHESIVTIKGNSQLLPLEMTTNQFHTENWQLRT